jgi:hypothetical protein
MTFWVPMGTVIGVGPARMRGSRSRIKPGLISFFTE